MLITKQYDINSRDLNINFNNVIIEDEQKNDEKGKEREIIISAVGDCTIGTDSNYAYYNSFNYKVNQVKNYSYFFSGVYSVLNNDDITIANLESVFTDYDKKAVKKYNYKGNKDYVNILKEGSVELVNLANNHTYDYLQKGYDDTVNVLKDAKIDYVGYNSYAIYEIGNIRFGFAGFTGWDYWTAKNNIDQAMQYFKKNNVLIVIFSFHWCGQHVYNHDYTQEKIGKYAIDSGGDLVIGHHPHVLQGIEKYKDKYIAYSLGNFVYCGRLWPYDSDNVILQMKYQFYKDGTYKSTLKLIPSSMTSSQNGINNYRPMIVSGNAKK